MLRLTWEEVAQAAKAAVATLADFEVGRRQPQPRTIDAIRTALEATGVQFIPEDGGGAGVRLRKPGAEPTPEPQRRTVSPGDEGRGGREVPEE